MIEQIESTSLDFFKDEYLLSVASFKKSELTPHLFLEYRWMRKKLNRRFHEVLRALWLSALVVFSAFLVILLYSCFTSSEWGLVWTTAVDLVSNSLLDLTGNGTAKKISSSWIPLLLLPLGIYWSLDAILGRKWIYCAQLFNELIKFRTNSPIPLNKYDASIYRARLNYLEASLACDLIDLDLFFHKSFSEIFTITLKKALQEQEQINSSIYCHDLKNGKKSVKDLASVIGKYQLRCRDHIDLLIEQRPNYIVRLKKHKSKSQKRGRKAPSRRSASA